MQTIEHLNRPNPRAEPRIHHVLVTSQVRHGHARISGLGLSLCQGLFLRARHHVIFFSFAKEPCRDLVAPPQLAADAPILDVLHPVTIAVLELGRVELHGVVHHRLQGRLRQFFHRQEPLQRQARLDHGVGAFAAPHLVGVVLHLDQVSKSVQLFRKILPALKPVHAFVGTRLRRHGAVRIDRIDGREAVLLAKVVVVGVVGGCHLQAPRPKLDVDVVVRNDGHLSVHHRHDGLFAHEVFVTLVVGVHANGRVPHDGFRTCCRHGDPTVVLPSNGVTHVVELAMLFSVNHLLVTQRRQSHRVPIDHAHPSVNQSLVVEFHERVDDAFVVALVHREARAVPVAARPELFQLFKDDSTVLMGPVPSMAQKLVP